jgi:Zn-dependent protease
MRGNVKIGSLLGIPVTVQWSWFIAFAGILWLLGARIYPGLIEDQHWTTYLIMAAASAVLFFVSVLLHEFAHAAVARLYKIPVKGITLFIFGGVAQIAREATKPFAEFLMAIVGPLTSMLIGGVFLGLLFATGVDEFDDTPVSTLLFWLFLTNVAMGIFNLIPGFPMDGGRVFRSVIWMITGSYSQATTIATWTGRVLAWAMIALGFSAMLGYNTYLANEPIGGLWLIFIGMFLEGAARSSQLQLRVMEQLKKYTAADLMLSDCPVIEREDPVRIVGNVMRVNPRVCYFVEEQGKLAGVLTILQMQGVPEPEWDVTAAGKVMVPSADLHPTAPEKPAADLLVEMESEGYTHMPVVEEGRVVGIVGKDKILNVLKTAGVIS